MSEFFDFFRVASFPPDRLHEVLRSVGEFETQETIYPGGVGGRFLFKPEGHLWVGIDIARGPEETYWYIQVGQAW